MRILLTRAAEDAARTRARLEAGGHRVLVSPVLRFEDTGEPLPRRAPDAAVATSARAFGHAARPAWDPTAVPLFLVGARTQAAARAAGFAGPAVVTATAETLAAALPAAPARRLLYLAGVDRKPELEAALAASPHRLLVVETYAARAATALTAAAAAALRGGEVDAVLHFSRRSATLFAQLGEAAGLDLGRTVHCCLSLDIASVFTPRSRVRVAAVPDEAGLLATLPAG